MHHGFIIGKMELRQTEFSFDFFLFFEKSKLIIWQRSKLAVSE